MSGLNEIKKRIKTTKNISKVTKSLELISAARMKGSIRKHINYYPYAKLIEKIINELLSEKYLEHPLSTPRKNPLKSSPGENTNLLNKSAVVIIGTHKGFVGSLSMSLVACIRENISRIQSDNPGHAFEFITLHKNSLKVTSLAGFKDSYHFGNFSDKSTPHDYASVFSLIKSNFLDYTYKYVYLAYIEFKNSATWVPVFKTLLPVTIPDIGRTYSEENGNSDKNPGTSENTGTAKQTYLIEPDADKVLDYALNELFEKQIISAVYSNNASENSARMVSMKNAGDRAKELNTELNINYNKNRQSGVTTQILELSSHIFTVKGAAGGKR